MVLVWFVETRNVWSGSCNLRPKLFSFSLFLWDWTFSILKLKRLDSLISVLFILLLNIFPLKSKCCKVTKAIPKGTPHMTEMAYCIWSRSNYSRSLCTNGSRACFLASKCKRQFIMMKLGFYMHTWTQLLDCIIMSKLGLFRIWFLQK